MPAPAGAGLGILLTTPQGIQFTIRIVSSEDRNLPTNVGCTAHRLGLILTPEADTEVCEQLDKELAGILAD